MLVRGAIALACAALLVGVAVPAAAAPRDPLQRYVPQLRYDAQETYFADSAAELTDNPGNRVMRADGSVVATAALGVPLGLGFLGAPTYANGAPLNAGDYIDVDDVDRQADAQAMHNGLYGNRIYGRTARAPGGRTWLQYWLFYYHNPLSLFGVGAHEGDWETFQVLLDRRGRPTAATFSQHGDADSQRCHWRQVELSRGAPVVYVALGSHASYPHAGTAGRGFLPDDSHHGKGPRIRPALDLVDANARAFAWTGRWGGMSQRAFGRTLTQSPAAPRVQRRWSPQALHDRARSSKSCGKRPRKARASAASAPAPRLSARRAGGDVEVRWRVAAEAATLVLTVAAADRPDVVSGGPIRVRGSEGRRVLALPPGDRWIVRASAFSRRGDRSALATAPVR